ncbi:MAG: M20/M25/M40 family metallo-hydrolase, partial [Actinomycetia bacterium]|nr:M20/M25/M40 family metallo-hydrolase [Actinomycetes bacterium]
MASNAAERLSALVKIPTVSADAATDEPFERAMATLRELYPAVHAALACERITPRGWLFRWPGTDAALREPLVLMAHVDVVPVDESDPWTYPPFDGVIADGSVWGRGTLDDKGALVCLFEAVESLVTSGFSPQRDVYLVIGGSEEVFGPDVATIAATMRGRGITPYLVLDEGGAVVDAPLSWVKVRAAMVGVGEKGVMTVRLDTRAEPGHASAPGSLTAVSRLGRAVGRLTPSTFPARLPAATTAML